MNLQRDILGKLLFEMEDQHPLGTIMRIVKPLYGIAESGVYWFATYYIYLCNRLKILTSLYDPCLFVSNDSAVGFGIIGMQTDNILMLCDDLFLDEEDK